MSKLDRPGHQFMRCPICRKTIERTDRSSMIDFRVSPPKIRAVCEDCQPKFREE